MIEIYIDVYLLNKNFIVRLSGSFLYQLIISIFSLMIGSFTVLLSIYIATELDFLNSYFKYLSQIIKGEYSEVMAKVLLQVFSALCSIALLLYFTITYVVRKHLQKVGILSAPRLAKIQVKYINKKLENLYTVIIFWFGFIPLFSSVFGSNDIKYNISFYVIITLTFAIPYTYINLKSMMINPN